MKRTLIVILLLLATPLVAAEKRIDLEVVVAASVDDVWNAWTTVEGVNGEKETRVSLTHDGFGDGEEWKSVQKYFEAAWRDYVLARLKKRFE